METPDPTYRCDTMVEAVTRFLARIDDGMTPEEAAHVMHVEAGHLYLSNIQLTRIVMGELSNS